MTCELCFHTEHVFIRSGPVHGLLLCPILPLLGLPSHPQHELAKRQMRGFSGMTTIYIKGGLNESRAFLSALKVLRKISLIMQENNMTHIVAHGGNKCCFIMG